MKIIKILANQNGSHANMIVSTGVIPTGWAIVPDDMPTPNFPFGEIMTDGSSGVSVVTSWTSIDHPSPSPSKQRKNAYNTERIIQWGGELLTVTDAALHWQYYSAEGNEKADELRALIATAKAQIRAEYPDE